MTVEIKQKIVSWGIQDAPQSNNTEDPDIEILNEHVDRPEELHGTTYKIKPGHLKHSLYLTINDIVLNPGTEHEERRPFEVFINSKDMHHYQWVVALTRIMSAVFRKGGDVAFLVEELRSVFDPAGGFWDRGKFKNSLVALIGDVIDKHLQSLGLIAQPERNEAAISLMQDKLEERIERNDPGIGELCANCGEYSVVMMDGCMTCMSCGDSKCG